MGVRHSTATIVAVLVLAVGCGTTEDTSAPDNTGGSSLEPPSATVVDGAEFTPPDDQASAGPVTELVAEVDLTGVAPDDAPYAIYAVGTDDGAYVAVAGGTGTATWLATVGPADGGLAVTDTVEIQPFYSLRGIDGMYVLDDGSVLVAGEFALTDPPEYSGTPDYGFVVVDPESGESRTTSVVPAGEASSPTGTATLSADGRTLYVYVSMTSGGERRLLAVDVASGEVVAQHDVAADPVTAAYWRLISQGLVARPDGGVRLLFNGGPDEASEDTIPVVVSYDADLRPDGDPVLLAEEPGEAEAGLVHGSTGGTVFAVLSTAAGGEIVAAPEGAAGGTALVRSSDLDYLQDLAVEPGQTWLTVPLQWGAAAVDLTSGEVAQPVDTGCREGQGVRWVFPGQDGAALLLGECEGNETLWIVAP